jgi:hypothetical protein
VRLVAATAGHGALFKGLYVALGLRTFPSPWQAMVGQVLGNALVGMVAFTIIEAAPGMIERRRAGRRAR